MFSHWSQTHSAVTKARQSKESGIMTGPLLAVSFSFMASVPVLVRSFLPKQAQEHPTAAKKKGELAECSPDGRALPTECSSADFHSSRCLETSRDFEKVMFKNTCFCSS